MLRRFTILTHQKSGKEMHTCDITDWFKRGRFFRLVYILSFILVLCLLLTGCRKETIEEGASVKRSSKKISYSDILLETDVHPGLSIRIAEDSSPKNGAYYQEGETIVFRYSITNSGNININGMFYSTRVDQARNPDIRGDNGICQTSNYYNIMITPGATVSGSDNCVVNQRDAINGRIRFSVNCLAYGAYPYHNMEMHERTTYSAQTGMSDLKDESTAQEWAD